MTNSVRGEPQGESLRKYRSLLERFLLSLVPMRIRWTELGTASLRLSQTCPLGSNVRRSKRHFGGNRPISGASKAVKVHMIDPHPNGRAIGVTE